MKIGNKEINTEKVNLILNLISFVAGILFYVRVGSSLENRQLPTPAPANKALRDSVLLIETKLKAQIGELKHQQDSLFAALKVNQQKLSTQNAAIKVVRHQIESTVKSDWDNIKPQDQEDYVNQLLTNLKKKSPPS